MSHGTADYYADGQWNFSCGLCGGKAKSGDAVKTWDNRYVCRHHKEIRNPQDFVRGVKDDQSLPWSYSEGADQFIPAVCTLQGLQGIPGYAVPGCSIPSYINLSFL